MSQGGIRGGARVVLGLIAAIGAVCSAACGPQLGAPQMNGCPTQEPAGGAPCDAPMTCSYATTDGGSGCGPTFACQGFVWQALGDACPPPPPSTCPANIPTVGAPCKLGGQTCTFDVPGSCPGVFVATCDASAQWTVADMSPPCPPHQCPTVEPVAGTTCDFPYDCTYTVVPSGCSAVTQEAKCVSGVWEVDAGPTCSPPPP